MTSAPLPAAALRDRAEQHVFALLPELPAIERRVLALLELAGADRATAAADVGLDATALRFTAKRARKALRRTRAPLAAGSRCERAELLVSDRFDAPLPRPDRKWLEIHVARCPRCTEHRALLEQARTELRVTFLAEPPQLPPAPTPPALETTEPAARLRVVPEPEAEPEPEVDAEPEPAAVATAPATAPRAPAAPPAPAPAAPAAPAAAAPPRRERPARARRAARTLAVLLALAAVVAAAIAGIGALDDDTPQRAPWDAPDAPEVRPAPLRDQ